MKRLLLVFLVTIAILFISGCIGSTGFEKSTTLCPDSVSIGYIQEQYRGEPDSWDGISISGTWTFK